jgi:hypothetical protein
MVKFQKVTHINPTWQVKPSHHHSRALWSGQRDLNSPLRGWISKWASLSHGVQNGRHDLGGWQSNYKEPRIKAKPAWLKSMPSNLCLGFVLVLRCFVFFQGNNRLIRAQGKKLLNRFVSHPGLPRQQPCRLQMSENHWWSFKLIHSLKRELSILTLFAASQAAKWRSLEPLSNNLCI